MFWEFVLLHVLMDSSAVEGRSPRLLTKMVVIGGLVKVLGEAPSEARRLCRAHQATGRIRSPSRFRSETSIQGSGPKLEVSEQNPEVSDPKPEVSDQKPEVSDPKPFPFPGSAICCTTAAIFEGKLNSRLVLVLQAGLFRSVWVPCRGLFFRNLKGRIPAERGGSET